MRGSCCRSVSSMRGSNVIERRRRVLAAVTMGLQNSPEISGQGGLMAKSWQIWRLSCACLIALFATTMVTATVADEPKYSTLIYDNGKEYKTSFYDAHLLGELTVRGHGPILVYSGRPSGPCSLPDCDPETTVYFQSTSDEPSNDGRFLRYPGNYYASESGELVARVRMFIGRCIDAREGVAWFIESLEGTSRQRASFLRSQVILEFVKGSQSDGQFGALMSTEWPREVDISIARAAVASQICKEITPLPRIYRSAAEYAGLGD
jgi:hypothetical protein